MEIYLKFISIMLLLSIILTILSVNLIHSIFWLTLSFFWASFFLVILNIISMAFLVLLIYVGAIAILFVFTIMMVDITEFSYSKQVIHLIPFLGISLILMKLISISPEKSINLTLLWQPTFIFDLKEVGFLLFNYYSYIVIGSAFILLIPMIGVLLFTNKW